MLERFMSYPVVQRMEKDMEVTYHIAQDAKYREKLENLLNQVSDRRDEEHAIVEAGGDDIDRVREAYGLRDLLALVEEAIVERINDPYPDYEIACYNTLAGVQKLFELIGRPEEASTVGYTFKFRLQAGVWVNYLPHFKTRQDAIKTRELVAARDIPVSDKILEVKDGEVQE